MPVLPVSAASAYGIFPFVDAAGDITANIVSPEADEHVVAIAAVKWSGGVDASSADFGVEFDGEAMDPFGDPIFWNSSKSMLQAYTLIDPPSGASAVVGSFASMPTTTDSQRDFNLVVATYSGVAADGIGEVEDVSGSSSVSASVTVDSVAEAHRVVSIHALGINALIPPLVFTAFNKTLRASTFGILYRSQLYLGDSPGDESVTATATINTASAHWAAKGVSLAPAMVVASASLQVAPIGIAPVGSIFRVAEPPADRFWEIPNTPDTLPPGQ